MRIYRIVSRALMAKKPKTLSVKIFWEGTDHWINCEKGLKSVENLFYQEAKSTNSIIFKRINYV